MANTGRNRYKRDVGDAAVRASEHILEISVDGSPYQLRGEMAAFAVSPNTSSFSVRIMGTGGKQYNDQAISSHAFTITYNVGTDGSFWDDIWFRKLNGEQPNINIISTKEDPRSIRKNGGRVMNYQNCRILNHASFDDANGGGTTNAVEGTVTLETMDSPVLVKRFKPVQGL